MRLPVDISTEQKILGTALLMVESLPEIMNLDEAVFSSQEYKRIFRAIKENHEKEIPITTGLNDSTVSDLMLHITSDVTGSIKVLREKSQGRRMINLFRDGMESIMQGEHPESVMSRVMTVMADTDFTEETLTSLSASLVDVFKKIIDVRDNGAQLGLTTGLDFERQINGFEAGKMYVVAARPAMGKSAFALEIIRRIASNDVPVGMMSLEMSRTSLAMRMLTSDMGIDGKDIRAGRLNDRQMEILVDSCNNLSRLPVYFDDNSYVTAQTLRSKAAFMKRRHDIGMLVIDYLQLATGNNDSREQDVAEVSRTCKNISKELDIPVVALAQLSRAVEMRDNKRPRLSDLRESGAIEQDADAVMFLYRPEYYGLSHYQDGDLHGQSTKNICEVITSKNREGETGITYQVFIPELMQFKNRAPHWTEN